MWEFLAAIISGLFSWLTGKSKKTAADVVAEQSQQELKDVKEANDIRDNPSKLDDELLIPPEQRK